MIVLFSCVHGRSNVCAHMSQWDYQQLGKSHFSLLSIFLGIFYVLRNTEITGQYSSVAFKFGILLVCIGVSAIITAYVSLILF